MQTQRLGAVRLRLDLLARRSLDPELQSHSITKELAGGYLGLCDHLSGHLKRAEARYRKVLRYAEKLESMRTLAIFRCHYADLLRLLKRKDEAQKHVRLGDAGRRPGRTEGHRPSCADRPGSIATAASARHRANSMRRSATPRKWG